MVKRYASAVWQGSLRDGTGSVSTTSRALENVRYSFTSRFEDGALGTNPEELIAAAHASCFAMALSAQLDSRGLTAVSIKTHCRVTLERKAEGWSITDSELEVVAHVPGADITTFEAAVGQAKDGCPVSRLLNAAVTVSAYLEAADTMGMVG